MRSHQGIGVQSATIRLERVCKIRSLREQTGIERMRKKDVVKSIAAPSEKRASGIHRDQRRQMDPHADYERQTEQTGVVATSS